MILELADLADKVDGNFDEKRAKGKRYGGIGAGWRQQGSRQASQPTDNRWMHCATTSSHLKTCCNKSHEWCRDQCSPRRGKGCGVGLNRKGLVSEHVDRV